MAKKLNDSSISTVRSLPPLIFVHGIKGATLSDRQGNQRWLTLSQALGLVSSQLSLPMTWNGDTQQHGDLIPVAPLRSVGHVAVYGPFLKGAESSGRPFYPFAYDWRRDNLENVAKFLAFLEGVSQQHEGARAQVVAHSMGGLITFVALNRRPDLFHSILFAGVPFRPCISLFEDLHAGTSNGFNNYILSPIVMFTFASPYFIFPLESANSRLVDVNGGGISLDWYSAEHWEHHKLGIFAHVEPNRWSDQQQIHLRNALRRAREFKLQVVCRKEKSFRYPPIAVLAGESRPTLSTVVRDGPHAVRGWDFRSAAKGAGDGRVAFADAMPPEGVPFTLLKSARQHAVLLNDTQQVADILAELCP